MFKKVFKKRFVHCILCLFFVSTGFSSMVWPQDAETPDDMICVNFEASETVNISTALKDFLPASTLVYEPVQSICLMASQFESSQYIKKPIYETDPISDPWQVADHIGEVLGDVFQFFHPGYSYDEMLKANMPDYSQGLAYSKR